MLLQFQGKWSGHCVDRLNRFGSFENVEVVPLHFKGSGITLHA